MRRKLPVQVIFREYFEGILAAVFLAFFLRIFVLSILYIPGVNMDPGLLAGDFVMGWKLAYGLRVPLSKEDMRLNPKKPTRGDIVSLRFPGDEEQILIRRIVGLPGERIKIQDGKISIDGSEATYSEDREVWQKGPSYSVSLDSKSNMAELQVPENSCFVLSDNRPRGDDSKSWGVVPLKNIESRLGFIWLSIDTENGRFDVRWDRLFKKIR